MNTIEPLNHDAVISLDNPEDKFHSASCTFRVSEIKQSLFSATNEPQDQWFTDGVLCKTLMPNRPWCQGKVMFQICFLEDDSEEDIPVLQEQESEAKCLWFDHSMGLVAILDNTAVVSLEDWNDKYGDIHGTFLSPELRAVVRNSYRPNYPGHKWFGAGVPAAILTPNNPWRKGIVTLQVGFIEGGVEEELAVTEEFEASSDEAELDTPMEVLSPLDEIRQMAAES